MNTISQSVLCTNYVQVPVTIWSPGSYNPSQRCCAVRLHRAELPDVEPSVWYTGSWVTFAGPAYWAQVLVGPVNGGVSLAIGTYQGWTRITDSPAVPVTQSFLLKITP